MNDIYEIDPVNGGKEGGLARVASLRDTLLRRDPDTLTVLAGDLLCPSALGIAPYKDGRLHGQQMIETMNALGLDYITFGNHEFDLPEESFYNRLKESQFTWISSNCFRENGTLFPGVVEDKIIDIKGVKVGIFGVTLSKKQTDYLIYKDPLVAAEQKVEELRPKVDILIALTHLTKDDDIRLASRLPEIDLILGGHEHENMQLWRGKDFTPIFKADANARTVYVHNLSYNTTAVQKLAITSKLYRITDALPEQPKTAEVVKKWRKIGYAGFRKKGLHPERIVATTDVALDGLEASVRNFPTTLTELIARSMLTAASEAQLALYNSGSIRVDDILPPGQITEYDIIRILPFGGNIVTVTMKGVLLERALTQGLANKGEGGFLQTGRVSGGQGKPWRIDGKELDPGAEYTVAVLDYLVKVGDDNLKFLVNTPEVPIIADQGDIRKALITELQAIFPAQLASP
ncbi:MAG: bifunctional metallophosphatase/5'-nucleotidase [Candidatus Electrothrix sp. GW3-4]|uniref:bifunctional metallophosphatase/5'-nucleotidase n=1 Tax=Candidatus Electrothrix sp. GW3-4 TaxID=3126740 RepID=UPI0030D05528